MSFKILTDTCANLPYEMVEELDLDVCSLTFFSEGKAYYSYKEGENVDLKMFYEMMREKKELTTSQVNPGTFKEFFEKHLEKGEDILYLGFTSGLSGTVQSAFIAQKELEDEYPDRKIIVVDTLCAALGQGVIVAYAAQMKKDGKSMEEIAQWIEDNKLRMCHWVTVDDLMFLHRGGRVSATAAIAGTLIGMKPIIHVDNDGKLTVVGKVRGRKQAIKHLVTKMEETVQDVENQIIAISHGDCMEEAEYLKSLLEEKFSFKQVIINCLDPVVGAHAGPGTMALFFLAAER